MIHTKIDTMTITTMANRCLKIARAALNIERQPQLSTGKIIPSQIAFMRKKQLRRLTKNMKLQQRPITNQINTLSLGVILETQTEEHLITDPRHITSQKGK
jgi:hypothetical protein